MLIRRLHVVQRCLSAIVLLCEILTSDACGYYGWSQLTAVSFANVYPNGAWNAVNGNAWNLQAQQTAAFFNATFDRPSTVQKFTLTLGDTSAIPSSARVSLFGEGKTWTVYINKTCSDTFYHWTSDAELTNCVTANLTTQVTAPHVFWAIDASNGNLVWRMSFERVELFIDGEADDFNGIYDAFRDLELRLCAFSSAHHPSCNCDPTGVASLVQPCNAGSGTCECRPTNISDGLVNSTHCRPEIEPLHSNYTPYHGPVSGGTEVHLRGVFLRDPMSIKLGNKHFCYPLSSNDTAIICVTLPADAEDENMTMPFHICWNTSDVISCVITRHEFTYRPDPVIHSLSRRKTLLKGGLPINITGSHFDSIYGYFGNPVVPLTQWPYIAIFIGDIITGGKEYTDNDVNNQSCSILSSSEIVCKTPEVSVTRNTFENIRDYPKNYPVELRIYLSRFITANSSFAIKANPEIDEWSPPDQGFNIYDDQTHIRITGSGLVGYGACCETGDYEVTVGGVACPISAGVSNALSCAPNQDIPPNSDFDRHGGSQVQLKVGSYKFIVGYLKYYPTWIDDPQNQITLAASLGGGLGGLILLAVLVILFCVYRRRKRRRQQEPRPQNVYAEHPASPQEQFLSNIDDDEARDIVKRCLIPAQRLLIRDEIGKGNYGKVYKGRYTDIDGRNELVAVKVAHSDNMRNLVEFLMEAVLMADFDHKNVMWLIAIVIDDFMKPHVVLPFMEHGDLRDYVKNTTYNFLVMELIDYGLQVADGMEYLSSKLVHRDLAARNCMIDRRQLVKVADFGLARMFSQEKEYYRPIDRKRALPVKWMAIESITDEIFTTKSDVWSFGVLLWELLTRGAKPYESVDNERMRRYIQDGNRLSKPSPMTPDFAYSLMQQCWDADPRARPSFSDITTYLRSHLDLDPGNSEAAAYRPADNDACEQVQMRDVPPEAERRRNEYLSLCQSVPMEDYLEPDNEPEHDSTAL